MMIPLLQEEVEKFSTQLEAVPRISLLKMDAALYEAKKLSMMKQERTNKSRQIDAARQNMMQLVDMVKETKECSIQQFQAAKLCPEQQ